MYAQRQIEFAQISIESRITDLDLVNSLMYAGKTFFLALRGSSECIFAVKINAGAKQPRGSTVRHYHFHC